MAMKHGRTLPVETDISSDDAYKPSEHSETLDEDALYFSPVRHKRRLQSPLNGTDSDAPQPKKPSSKSRGKKKQASREESDKDSNVAPAFDPKVQLQHALSVGPPLAHSSSMTVQWASLQVSLDSMAVNAIATETLLLNAKSNPNLSHADKMSIEKNIKSLQDLKAKYTGANSIAHICDPYKDLHSLWQKLHTNDEHSPVQSTRRNRKASSSKSLAAPPEPSGRRSSAPSTVIERSLPHKRLQTSSSRARASSSKEPQRSSSLPPYSDDDDSEDLYLCERPSTRA